MTILMDYYRGYEGYGELTVLRRGESGELGITLWDGFVDEILGAISPSSTGWTDLALYYHTHTGWYDEAEWTLPDPRGALAQLEAIDPRALSPTSSEALRAWIDLLRAGIDAGDLIVLRDG
ncbi:MAG: hypothetical protein R3B09_26140 [Nannocystaceae bacterium]